jgi:hypothetical protein
VKTNKYKFGYFFKIAFLQSQPFLLKKWKEIGFWNFLLYFINYAIMYIAIGEKEFGIEASIGWSLIGAYIILEICRYLWFAVNAPFKLLQDQALYISKIEENKGKRIFEFILNDTEISHKNGNRACSYILIHNISNFDIENCYLKAKIQGMKNLTGLSWSENNPISNLEYGQITIRPGDIWRTDISVAWEDSENAVLCIFPIFDKDRVIKPGIFQISITAFGKINNSNIEYSEDFLLEYQGKNKLLLKKIKSD